MKAIIMAAGKGTRLQPLTHTRPKVMIPIAGKPILQHVLEACEKAGITEAGIIVKYLGKNIKEFFGKNFNNLKITYFEQGEKIGTGEALLSAEGFSDEFILLAGDIVVDSKDLKKMIELAKDGKNIIGLKQVSESEISNYGAVQVDEKRGKARTIVEKPKKFSHKPLINTSVYALNGNIFEDLKKTKLSERGELELTNALNNYAKRNELDYHVLEEYWLDMGMPWHLLNANEFLLKKVKKSVHESAVIENSVVKGEVVIEKGVKIMSSHIEGPAIIEENAELGPHSYVRPYTVIGRECSIGDSTTVKNSILMRGINAKHLAYIGDSIIGDECNFGAATQIANFRFDEGYIKAEVQGKVHVTLRKKFGCVIGDNTKTGVLSCIMPGKMIGDNCWIGAGTVVDFNVERNSNVYVKQNIIVKKK